MSDNATLVQRLRAPHYWMSGSNEGHEGDNDAPFEAAARIAELEEQNARLQARIAELEAEVTARDNLRTTNNILADGLRLAESRIREFEAALSLARE